MTRILLADDDPVATMILSQRMVQWGHEVQCVSNGREALEVLLGEDAPRIAVLDWLMPEKTGIEICQVMREREEQGHSLVYCILLTSKDSNEAIVEGLQSGAHDYLIKPVNAMELKLRIEIGTRTLQYEKALALKEYQTRVDVYNAISDLAETRDHQTGLHIRRIGIYSRMMALRLKLSEIEQKDLEVFAPLHDIGKVGISDAILLAPRKLTNEEYKIIQTHTTLGYDILKDKPSMQMAAHIALSHHERWDGQGYPQQLSKDEIPLEARIVAIMDVYDALRSKRPYKKAWSHQEALEEIYRGKGTQFDPQLTELFMVMADDIAKVFDEMQ